MENVKDLAELVAKALESAADEIRAAAAAADAPIVAVAETIAAESAQEIAAMQEVADIVENVLDDGADAFNKKLAAALEILKGVK